MVGRLATWVFKDTNRYAWLPHGLLTVALPAKDDHTRKLKEVSPTICQCLCSTFEWDLGLHGVTEDLLVALRLSLNTLIKERTVGWSQHSDLCASSAFEHAALKVCLVCSFPPRREAERLLRGST